MALDDIELTPDLLLQAYAAGIFPMAESRNDPELFWVDPKERGVLPLDGFHVSRSLRRLLRRGRYNVRLDTDFEAVLDGCADRAETWINTTIRDLMLFLFERGQAHAFCVYDEKQLVGGVYGLTLGGAYFGESMFSKARDASKVALAYAVDHLSRCGFTLFDTQFLTDHLQSLGAVEIPRHRYHTLLAKALQQRADINKFEIEQDPQAVLQRITQTS